MTQFFTTVTHFRDARIMRIDRRLFKSIADHDENLIAFWNETVGDDDEIWHLGDFAKGTLEQATGPVRSPYRNMSRQTPDR
jgi:calcineurin-like phosphoesterase family protein